MEQQDPLVIRSIATIRRALKDSTGVGVEFMSASWRRTALLELSAASSQLESLRLRLIAGSSDIADEDGARDIAAWLTHETRTDRSTNAHDLQLAESLDRRWPVVARALEEAELHPQQAEVIVRGLQALPADIPREILDLAERQLVQDAATFGPRELRILARRVLDIVAPELGEEEERRALEREDEHAWRTTSLRTRDLGDGTTEIDARVPTTVAARLLTCLHAFTSPRRTGAVPADDRLHHHRKLGLAFCALLEGIDPTRLPLHGGDATTVLVSVDLATLRDGLGVAGIDQDEVITAGQARRLACSARILPVVLGGKSEILDFGRRRRLFSPAQRKAMAVRDKHCRAQGCHIPAAWCEAHHAKDPWSQGGKTDLTDGILLCNFHHHRAHDPAFHHTPMPNGDVRFHRRR